MDGLLKRACDNCTKSKVKCSGHEPCKRCSSRGLTCIYRPKKKRGPPKKRQHRPNADEDYSRSIKRLSHADANNSAFTVVTSYERRVWSVFFTIFKNQNRTREEHPWAWCWFASQLEKLRTHLEERNNSGALQRLQVWLEALDMDQKSVNKLVVKKCTIDPSRCGTCSAAAIGLKDDTVLSPAGPLNATVMNSIRNGTAGNIHKMQLGKVTSDLDANEKPMLLFESSDAKSVVHVNELFTNTYGYSSDTMTALLDWSGGGFLPWGGDLLARILVKESDLIIFLQILALKFQALGIPKHGKTTSREVPSTHVFMIWARNTPTGETNLVQECFLRCLHVENYAKEHNLSTQMRIIFEPLGPAVSPGGDYHPTVYKDPIKAEPNAGHSKPAPENAATGHTNHNHSAGATRVDQAMTIPAASYETIDKITHGEVPTLDLPTSHPPPPQYPTREVDNATPKDIKSYDSIPKLLPLQRQDSSTLRRELEWEMFVDGDIELDTPAATNSTSALVPPLGPTTEEDVSVDWLDNLLEWSTQQPE